MTRIPNLLPLHPGEILCEEFLKPMGLSIKGLARDLHVPPSHISGIVNEKRGISAVMALRLARYFGSSPDLWLGLHRRLVWHLLAISLAVHTGRSALHDPGMVRGWGGNCWYCGAKAEGRLLNMDPAVG